MMKFLLTLFFMSQVFFVNATYVFSSDYLTVQEYNTIHPEHIERVKQFNSIVQQKGVPLANGVQSRPVRIVFIYPGNQVSDYWRRSIKSFTRRMDELNVKYEITDHFTKPNVELRVQEQQLQQALAQDPDYLVYTLSVSKHRKLIERILTKGRPKLILQNITTPLRDWEGKQPFLYVGFDHVIGSTNYLARYLLDHTGGTGNYAMLYFDHGYVSAMRGDTVIKYLENSSNHQLVASYYTDGQRIKAKNAVLEILKEHEVKFIYACATDVAFGAIDALRETNMLGKVIVNGWGGGSEELKAILQGELDYTVMRMNDDNGVAMAEAIRLDIEKKADTVPTVFSGEFVIIDKGIRMEDLKKLKAKAFRYSGLD